MEMTSVSTRLVGVAFLPAVLQEIPFLAASLLVVHNLCAGLGNLLDASLGVGHGERDGVGGLNREKELPEIVPTVLYQLTPQLRELGPFVYEEILCHCHSKLIHINTY